MGPLVLRPVGTLGSPPAGAVLEAVNLLPVSCFRQSCEIDITVFLFQMEKLRVRD